jgi:hypothetical protein
MAMAGPTHRRIGLLLHGVRRMLSLLIDYNGKTLTRTDLVMLEWVQEEMTVLKYPEPQLEMFKVVPIQMVTAGLTNMVVGMLQSLPWVKSQHRVGFLT